MVRQAHHVRVALFGGSFNPPHWAHRQVMDYLRGLPQFDEVWMVPAFDHPFEKNLISFNHREKMCELTLAGLAPKVKVCTIEKELSKSPSYMIDTVWELKKRNPASFFTIVIGSDCQNELPQWKDFEKLKKEAQFFEVPRPGIKDSPFMNISSTEIRDLIQKGKPYTRYLVPEVAGYIEEQKLYK